MNNVIQNINIEDIVPNSYHHQYNNIEIEELISSIKKHGVLEPITLRPKGNKYELILGNKRYEAAIVAGLKTIPAIIKNIDDNKIKEYFMINDNSLILNTSQLINSNSKNIDVINLSKLNEEYERDELKMNNNQFNNTNQPINNEPTFGGRFFPSLEDEPTNMNFVNNIETQPIIESQPNNSFIDLTDLNVNNIPTQMPQTNFVDPKINNNISNQNISNDPSSLNQNISPNFDNQPINSTPIVDNNNIINLDNLKQNPEMQTQPMNPEMNIDNNFQDVINDFHPNGNIVPNQFEQPPMNNTGLMYENIQSTPIMEPVMNQPYNVVQEPIAQSIEIPQNSFQENVQPNYNSTVPEMTIPTTNIEPIIPQANIEQPISMQEVVEQPMQQSVNQKDIIPVINTLKALAINLETFGYTIRITDEDLPASYKITIEVDK